MAYVMGDKENIISQISAEILAEGGIEATFPESAAAEGICRMWLDYALQCCNRTDMPPALLSIVKDTATAAYNRRGDEGAKSASVGGQSMTYDDLHITMRQRLIDAGLRVFRL